MLIESKELFQEPSKVKETGARPYEHMQIYPTVAEYQRLFPGLKMKFDSPFNLILADALLTFKFCSTNDIILCGFT